MKILIFALSGIGDALMYTPSIKLLRQALPDAQIDALVMFKGVKDIYERNPHLTKVYHFDFLKEGAVKSFRFLFKLRKKYDFTINVYPANRREYNIISYLIGASRRGGIRYLRKDFQNFGFLNNVRITEDDKQHNVITNIRLTEKLIRRKFNEEPQLEFPLTNSDLEFAERFFRSNNIGSREFVVGFHPGSATLKNHIKRRWEPEKFAALGSLLIKNQNARILIFGGPEEDELKESISGMISSGKALVVRTENLAQSAAIMKRCGVFVSNDSSLMHVASAVQLKVLAVLGPTNPYYIHPWKTVHKVERLDLECSPCFIYSPRPLICFRNDVEFKCIKELEVEGIYRSVLELLQE